MFVLLCKTNQLPVFVKTKIKNKFIDCTHFLQSTKFSLSLFTFHSEERLVNNSKRKRLLFWSIYDSAYGILQVYVGLCWFMLRMFSRLNCQQSWVPSCVGMKMFVFVFSQKIWAFFSFSRKCVRKIMTKRYFRGIFFCPTLGGE